MTKTQFEAIAAIVKDEGNAGDKLTAVRIAEALGIVLARYSPNFDRARWLAACGVAE